MTVIRRVKFEDLVPTIRKDVRKIHDRLVQAAKDTAEQGVAIVRTNAPVAFGEIAEGVEIRVDKNGFSIVSTAPHSVWAEFGSRPHMPPVEPLVEWVKLKIPTAPDFVGVQLMSGNVGFRKTAADNDGPVRKIAWAVAMKIKQEGTKPTWYMRRSFAQILPLFLANARRQLARPID